MRNPRTFFKVMLAVALLAAPAVSLHVLTNYYDAPHLQPLALTSETAAVLDEAHGGGPFARIDVNVDWGTEWNETLTPEALRQKLVNTLKHQTNHYQFNFNDIPGDRVDVTFVVGPNSYGPFPPGGMISGITSALVALRTTNRARN